LFKEKSRQLDKEVLIDIERHTNIQDAHKFYKRLNDVKRPFKAKVAMCRAKNGELLTNKDQVLSRWKERFEQHLNKEEKRDAGVDSIAAELLKNGGPQLVNALEEVIQLAWTSEILPETWTKGELCPVYNKLDKLDCTKYRGAPTIDGPTLCTAPKP
jgi:hypothetical protein